MCKTCSVIIALRRKENLSFVLQTAERIAVYHSVTVMLKTGSQLSFRLVNKSAPALIRKAGVTA